MFQNLIAKPTLAQSLFSLNIPGVDELFQGFAPGDFALLYGSPSVISLTSLLYVRAQLPSQLGGLGSNVVFIDGENTAELPSENLALTDFMGTEGRQNGLILSQIS